MVDYLLIHGAWHGGWCWDRVTARLRSQGHRAMAPSLAGLGERAGELDRSIDLDRHIADILACADAHGLQGMVLVGHSYGGFPATAAAQRLGARVAHLVLLDAFLPADGEILLDHAPALIAPYREAAAADPHWHIPPLPSSLFGLAAADQAWVDARLGAHPVATYFQPIDLPAAPAAARKTYLRCRAAPGELLQRSIARAQADPAWHYEELDAPHDAMISHPELLAARLLALA